MRRHFVSAVDRWNSWLLIRKLHRLRCSQIAALLSGLCTSPPPPEGRRLLHIGCGAGGVTFRVAASGAFSHLLGVDLSGELIAAATAMLRDGAGTAQCVPASPASSARPYRSMLTHSATCVRLGVRVGLLAFRVLGPVLSSLRPARLIPLP